ncbi:class B sortase [Butyrivibrio sp. MB2005]|uniref:class B sortase n=1 Tax=Butyrivibrio sp. MB2005 TaxID=1280678 RepID=UPI0004245364|nr:class B sortase [Butyrivibrio sp. MB2005]
MSKKKYTVIALLIIVCGICAGIIGYYFSEFFRTRSEIQDLQEIAYENDGSSKKPNERPADNAVVTESPEKNEDSVSSNDENLNEIPVDIEALQETNPDILAWISIPDTVIDYPIVQHPNNDEYYLDHGPDGMYSSYGCPFIEICDQLPFEEFNTVVYGHNMNDGSMFAALHKYEDREFYDGHRDFYIYTADHIYLYTIFAAVMYSDARIPYYYDDAVETDRTAFLESLRTDIVEKRSYISDDLNVNKDSNIITLSTCDKKLRDNRFLIVAKLTQIDGQDVE